MAKVVSWLKGAKGRIGGVTLYQSGGKTIAREATSSAKDANTFAQAIQRALMKTVSDQYSAFKNIADHSFEGKSNGAKCMAKFQSDNLRMFRERAAELQNAGNSIYNFYQFAHKGQQKFVPAAIILSRGSLPRIMPELSSTDRETAHFYLESNSYGQIISYYNLKRGDQLTFVNVVKNAFDGSYDVAYARVILDPRNADGTAADLSTTFCEDNDYTIVKPNMRNQGLAGFKYNAVANALEYWVGNIPGQVAATGIIISRKERGKWLRSTCKLVLSEAVIGSDLQSLGAAADASLTSAEIYTGNDLYLDNAGEGGAQGDSNTPPDNSTLVVSNLVSINGVEQNVSSGNVNIGNILNRVDIYGQNIPSGMIEVGEYPGHEAPTVFSGSGNHVYLDFGGIVSNEDLDIPINKVVGGVSTLWFTIHLSGNIQGME